MKMDPANKNSKMKHFQIIEKKIMDRAPKGMSSKNGANEKRCHACDSINIS